MQSAAMHITVKRHATHMKRRAREQKSARRGYFEKDAFEGMQERVAGICRGPYYTPARARVLIKIEMRIELLPLRQRQEKIC